MPRAGFNHDLLIIPGVSNRLASCKQLVRFSVTYCDFGTGDTSSNELRTFAQNANINLCFSSKGIRTGREGYQQCEPRSTWEEANAVFQ